MFWNQSHPPVHGQMAQRDHTLALLSLYLGKNYFVISPT
jgi:hypothetical protein